MANETKTEVRSRCVAKLGEPGKMHECGRPCGYLLAEESGGYSGWFHTDEMPLMGSAAIVGHHAVPESMVW
jgi:hypothetical protein